MQGRLLRHLLAGTVSMASLALALATGAAAQTATAAQKLVSGTEEITVTVQRREERLQSVPVAVSAFSADTLERKQITNLRQLDGSIPNVVMNPNTGTSSAAKIFLRGLGEDESFFTADIPVAIYVDDVYLARQTGSLLDLIDIERIEVLRGPQGTLYGRNTTGGAIKFVSRKPTTDSMYGQADFTFGSYGTREGRGSINVPITDTIAAQAAVVVKQNDGYTRNAFNGQRVNDQDIRGGRVAVRFTPNDRLDAQVTVDGSRERSSPGYPVLYNQADKWTTNSEGQRLNNLDAQSITGRVSYDFGGAQLVSITAARGMVNQIELDADGKPTANFEIYQDQHQHQFSQELQLQGKAFSDRLDWITGLYYFNEHNRQLTYQRLLISGVIASRSQTQVALDTSSYSAFASGTWSVGQLRLTAGGRFTKDIKQFGISLLPNTTPPPFGTAFATNAATATRSLNPSYYNFSPRGAIDYTVQGDGFTSLLYASYTRGFKSGGFDGRATSAVLIPLLQPLAPEKNRTFEIGAKSDFLNRKVRLNANYYHLTNKSTQLGATVNGTLSRLNAGDIRSQGIEAELTVVPVTGLELSANVGTIDGKYTAVTQALVTSCSAFGVTTVAQAKALDLKQAPDLTYQLAANYTIPVSGLRGNLTLGGSYEHKSKYYNSLCNSEKLATDNHRVFNAQLAYETDDGKLRLTLAGRNLSDKTYIQGGFDSPGVIDPATIYTYPPRTITFDVRYRF